MSDYTTKFDVPSSLNGLKSKLDKLYVNKLEFVLADLKKLSDMIEKELVKKCAWWIG